MFQAVSPPIIRSTKLYIQLQVLSNKYCCLLLAIEFYSKNKFEKLMHLFGFIIRVALGYILMSADSVKFRRKQCDCNYNTLPEDKITVSYVA